MSPYAATNLQLFNQLLAQGYTQENLTRVRHTYELARLLFSGRIASSGKTQLSHCVRTAGILAFFHTQAHLVAAGLIHNVYGRGDFGDGVYGISEQRRNFLRQTLGQDIEQVAADFANLKWNETTISNFLSGKGPLTRDIVFLRLADTLEHHLDSDIQNHLPFVQKKRASKDKMINPLVIQAAEAIGLPSLAEELERAKSEKGPPHTGGFVLVPASYGQKIFVKLLMVISRYWPGGQQPWYVGPKRKFFHHDVS